MLKKVLILLCSRAAVALQFVLNTADPWCIDVTPVSYTEGMTVTYTSTGVNEEQVKFTATQDLLQLEQIEGERDVTVTLKNRGSRAVTLCWQKLDRKAKKINFLVSQNQKDMNKKATQETIDDLQRTIEELQSKLD